MSERQRLIEMATGVLLGVAVCVFLQTAVGALLSCTPRAHGYDEQIAAAIRTLQPSVDDRRAAELSDVIEEAASDSGVDPLLIVALIMRESSFDPAVERGERRGAMGEFGLLQINPRNTAALRLRPPECEASLPGARCQIITGVRYFAAVKQACPGSRWRRVAAYGMRRCPTEEQAGMDPSTRRAHALHTKIGGTGW